MIRRPIVAALAALGLFCIGAALPVKAAAQGGAPASAKSIRESLRRADRSLSTAVMRKGFSAGMGDVLATDAIFLYDGAPVVSGRANVLTLLQSQPALATLRVEWLPVVVAVSSDGSLGATYGISAIAEVPAKPDSGLRFGKYISMWRRDSAGSWVLAAHVEMGLASGKFVPPPNFASTHSPLGNPLSGTGAPFAQADIDFARMAGAQGAPAAFGAFAAADAATLPGTGEIVIGPAAINARMLESPAATAKWEWHPIYSEGTAAGDLGFTVGEATIGVPGPNGVTEYHSKYLTVWRRQPDGTVRFIVDGGNDR